jgi:hypothetical protein
MDRATKTPTKKALATKATRPKDAIAMLGADHERIFRFI